MKKILKNSFPGILGLVFFVFVYALSLSFIPTESNLSIWRFMLTGFPPIFAYLIVFIFKFSASENVKIERNAIIYIICIELISFALTDDIFLFLLTRLLALPLLTILISRSIKLINQRNILLIVLNVTLSNLIIYIFLPILFYYRVEFSFTMLIMLTILYFGIPILIWQIFSSRFSFFKNRLYNIASILIFIIVALVNFLNILSINSFGQFVSLQFNGIDFESVDIDISISERLVKNLNNSYDLKYEVIKDSDGIFLANIFLENKVTQRKFYIDKDTESSESNFSLLDNSILVYKRYVWAGSNSESRSQYRYSLFDISSEIPKKTIYDVDFYSCHIPMWDGESLSYYTLPEPPKGYSTVSCYGNVEGLGEREYGPLEKIRVEDLEFYDMESFSL